VIQSIEKEGQNRERVRKYSEVMEVRLGVGKNPQSDSNRIIQTKKWLSGRVAVDRRVVSQTFSVVDGLKWTSSVF
jgi:hypothetical protein